MSSNESTAYDAAMHQYEKQYDGLKAELQTLGFIGQGSVSTRRITCGRPACRCHSDPEARHGPYHHWTRKAKRRHCAGRGRSPDPTPPSRAGRVTAARRRPGPSGGVGGGAVA